MTIDGAHTLNGKAKPFLRWAGGKSWLTKHLLSILPSDGYNNYHEPFLGGGAVFLALNPPDRSFLSDLNRDLIETYESIRDDLSAVVSALAEHRNTADYYYDLRERVPKGQVDRAARFIYLNQTSFNGIYRVNLQGRYNVPYGHRTKEVLDVDNLTLVSGRLQGVDLVCQDFERSLRIVEEGDLVFLDPPYTVSHNKNGFIKYNQKLFSIDDQSRLREFIDGLNERGAHYILTNAAHDTVAEIFSNGDSVREMSRASVVGGKDATRGQTTEYLFTNIGAV